MSAARCPARDGSSDGASHSVDSYESPQRLAADGGGGGGARLTAACTVLGRAPPYKGAAPA